MRLGIIGGAGLLGATTAFCVAQEGLAKEIVLTDIRENVARSHAMDIEQAACEFSSVKVSAGSIDDAGNCDIVLNAAGIPEMSTASRDDYLSGNIIICRELAESIRRWGTAPVILSATNPIDVLNYALFKLTGLPRERFIGFSANDTLRFKWAVSKETGIPVSRLDALVIGEHGDGQVPLFSCLKNNVDDTFVKIDSEAKLRIQNRVKTWFGEYQKLNSGRSSGWTSGVGLCNIIKAITADRDEILPCSVIPDGEYGFSGLSIGLPVRLGRAGVREIVKVDLTEEEKTALSDAAEKIRKLIELSENEY